MLNRGSFVVTQLCGWPPQYALAAPVAAVQLLGAPSWHSFMCLDPAWLQNPQLLPQWQHINTHLLPQWQQINTHLLPQWQQINTQLLPQQQQINTLAPASSVPHGCCSVEQLGAISYTVTTSFTIPVVVAQLRRPLPPIYPPLINLPSPVVMSNPPRGALVE